MVLENGDELQANIVVSNLDAKRTFTQCMDEADLPPEFIKELKTLKLEVHPAK